MSDLMLYGVLRMPYDMTMSSELSRRQFYGRVQKAADRLAAADAEIEKLRAELASRGAAQGRTTSIDTPEFWSLIRSYIANVTGGYDEESEASRAAVIAHIDAWGARQAGKEG